MRNFALCIGIGALTLTSACEPTFESARAEPAPVALAPEGPAPATAASGAVRALQQVCLPLLAGGDAWKVARAAGFVDQDGQWVLPIDGESRIVLNPPDRVNARLCSASITYPMNEEGQLEDAVGHWADAKTPPLRPLSLGLWTRGPTFVSNQSSWSGHTPAGSESLVLTEVRTAQGGPIAGVLDRSNLQLSVTPTSRRAKGRSPPPRSRP